MSLITFPQRKRVSQTHLAPHVDGTTRFAQWSITPRNPNRSDEKNLSKKIHFVLVVQSSLQRSSITNKPTGCGRARGTGLRDVGNVMVMQPGLAMFVELLLLRGEIQRSNGRRSSQQQPQNCSTRIRGSLVRWSECLPWSNRQLPKSSGAFPF